MSTETLTASLYRDMMVTGAAALGDKRQTVNALNVFPVPDGDTGDNMYMTIRSGCEAAGKDPESLCRTASAISKGMLLGARGNSGVILSRIFAGLAKGLDGLETASVTQFSAAMDCAVSEAYASVSKPVEGTILTVLKDSASKASETAGKDFETYFSTFRKEMQASLERTPELLPILKEANVVDSGGAGLLCIVEGMDEALRGNVSSITAGGQNGTGGIDLDAFGPESELEWGYCTEFLLRLQSSKIDLAAFNEDIIRERLCAMGDSVVCFREGSIVKAHVHTFKPGEVLNACQQWGEFLTLKIENMNLQHREQIGKEEPKPSVSIPRKRLAVVTVASGEGLSNALTEAGADYIIEGGQSMNPSTAGFIEAFEKVNADTILVFPNNPNIVMTARQAASLYGKSRIEVIPSKDFGAGYVAIASVDHSDKDTDALVGNALQTIGGVTTGLVSRAIRDAHIGEASVREGDWIGIKGGEILSDSPSRNQAAAVLCGKLEAGEHEVVLVFYGCDVPAEEAEALQRELSAGYRMTEIILTPGGQPVYDYIIVLC